MSHDQKVSLSGAILMNINLMVGASAFIGPAMMTEHAGAMSVYGWLFAAALFFPVVWCVAQMTKVFPGKGSFYSYSKNTISTDAGFLSGWAYFLGYISIGSLQLLSLNHILAREFPISLFTDYRVLFNVILIGILMSMTFMSVRTINRIQSNATLFKLTPLIIGVVSLLYYFKPSDLPAVTNISPVALLPTIPMALFGFWGFEGACSISHLIKDSHKNASRAVLFGFIATVAIYTLYHLGLLSIMGAQALKTFGAPAFINYMNLPWPIATTIGNILITSAIIVALVNAIFGGIIANGAMLCAMAEEKMVFCASQLATRAQKSAQPIGAAVAHCLGIFLSVTFLASKEILNAMSNLGVLAALFMTIVALLIIERRKKDLLGQAISILGLIACLPLSYYSWQIMGNSNTARLITAGPLLLVMVVGYGLYVLNRCKAVHNK